MLDGGTVSEMAHHAATWGGGGEGLAGGRRPTLRVSPTPAAALPRLQALALPRHRPRLPRKPPESIPHRRLGGSVRLVALGGATACPGGDSVSLLGGTTC
jgi:hypothetical protein